MLILSELVVPILWGVLHLLELLLSVASGVLLTSPAVAGPQYASSGSAVVHLLLGPIRAVARHPGRFALAFGVAAICIAALWRP